MVFAVHTGGNHWCPCRGWRSHEGRWQEGRSSAAWSRSQASCFLQKQGSCSTTSLPDARSAEAEGMFASCSMCVALAAWLFGHTYTLNRNPLRLNRFHWRWRRLEENELGLLRRHLHARLGQSTGVQVQSLFVSQIFLEILRSFSNFLRYFSNFLRNFSNFLRNFSNFLGLSQICDT